MTGLPRRPAALLALAFAWLAFTTWIRPLALPDEGRYIGVAWEMVRSGEWLTPTLDGLPYFHKPPLFYWITGASLSLFGNVEWAGRVAPWSGACLMVASAFLFGRRWLGDTVGRAWALVLATMPLVFMSAQYSNLDMLVAGWITATILAFAHASLLPMDDPSRRKWLIAGGALAAGATLAKGLIGFVLPGMVLIAWLLLARRWRRILSLFWWPVLLVFLVVAAPWFAVMQERFDAFLHYFFVVQHFSRYTQAGFNNAHGPWFFPVVLLVFGLPWTLWLTRRAPAPADDTARAVRVLAWVWLVAIVAFFSLPRSKLVGYVLPAVPPLALLVALRWQAVRELAGRGAMLARVTVIVAAITCLVAPVAVALAKQKHTRDLARIVATQPDRPIAFVRNYYFDLAFYARLQRPVPVLERWDDKALTQADNWRRELLDASEFLAPGTPSPLLPTSALVQANCPGVTSWVVGGSDMKEAFPMLASNAREVARSRDTVLWEVRDWVPVAAQCGAGTPSASSAGKS
ncbi:ArnT family glycosyltransferase [Ramlibacter algicola]|uniref:Glycosyltransferase family 39 protein n=1 Tax=Ramlibacter algicola TaxID=2795217 RepID=A0A934PVV9_9BURK|nr:glycosyltransferase family 39 protein [Ramlibacter algicola]MBK0391430.1 glycosyltransferase family 39 protein [Ramlibacter algicola]